MRVSEIVAAAFALADERDRGLQRRWIDISFKIGPRVPGSLLTLSVQRVGRLDSLLRTMEAEFCGLKEIDDDAASEERSLLSEAWVGSLYEIVRAMEERKVHPAGEEFSQIHHDLRLIRIPIEKYQLAQDSKLRGPIEFVREMPRPGDVPHIYDRKDINRAHIMPMQISSRGAMAWLATDLKAAESRWIERQDLSDRFMNLWDVPSA
nr:hypothetical protein [uncultured Cupriavidus sp.]